MDETHDTPERTERKRALGGILILLGLVALAVLIISLDEIFAARVAMVDVVAELPESKGLVPGAAVWIAGHEVGEVTAVNLRPPDHEEGSRILAIARIPEELLPLLRGDSRARIASPRLAGEPVLELEPGSPSAPPFSIRDTIPARHGPNRTAETLAAARLVLAEVDTLMDQLRAVGALYRQRRPMIDDVMSSVQLASAELDRTALAFENGPMAGALRDARLGERFAALRASLATVQQGLGRYTSGPLGERIAALGVRTDSLRADVALLDSLASDPNAGFVGRIRSDSALMVEAARTRAQMDSLVEDVKSNPFMFF